MAVAARRRVPAAAQAGVAAARGQWVVADGRGRVLIAGGLVVGAFLTGAFLFGVWHVLFGGFIKWNWRAGLFGFVLAAVSGALLALEATFWRKLARR